MIIHCPMCGYSRTQDDATPSSECPQCGINYQKALTLNISKNFAKIPKEPSTRQIINRLLVFIFFTAISSHLIAATASTMLHEIYCITSKLNESHDCRKSNAHNLYTLIFANVAWSIYFIMCGFWVAGKRINKNITLVSCIIGGIAALPLTFLYILMAIEQMMKPSMDFFIIFLLGAPTILFSIYVARKHWGQPSDSHLE